MAPTNVVTVQNVNRIGFELQGEPEEHFLLHHGILGNRQTAVIALTGLLRAPQKIALF